MSSRIIVKNLPKNATKEQLEEHFSKFGQVTDVRLVHTPSGIFRRFAFIGYHNEFVATTSVKYFNKTFLDTCKIEVALAKAVGDKDTPRPWSRYSKGTSVSMIKDNKEKETLLMTGDLKDQDEDLKKECAQRLNQDLHKSRLASYLGELYELEADPEFTEFMSLHKSKTTTRAWTNDDLPGERVPGKRKRGEGQEKSEKKTKVRPSLVSVEARRPGGKGILLTRTHLRFDEDEENNKERLIHADKDIADSSTRKALMSDMEYLKSKIVKEDNSKQIKDIPAEVDEDATSVDEEEQSEMEKREEEVMEQAPNTELCYTLKMRGVPFKSKPEDVRAFFYPLPLSDIRMITDQNGKPTGVVYVDFISEAEMLQGLRRNRDCMGRRYIELFKEESQDVASTGVMKPRPWENKKEEMEGVEAIGESGRLFIRNLPYSINEEELTELFEKYGPLTEVHMPIDKSSGKPIGLAFITYMLPEHAVKAYSEIDGQIFHGRLIHILPSRPPVTPTTQTGEQRDTTDPAKNGSSYKKSKAAALKSQSGSAHNWNTLFLGSNAVVDSMAEKYDVEKSDLLDPEESQSLAVRMALGETELVTETREFLEEQGVVLDVFQLSKPKRSKRIILAKNLPFGTSDKELKELFEPFGSVGRVVIPPGGISALVEYSETVAAKKAFKKLAYREFKNLPLYLEWAPVGVFKNSQTDEGETDPKTEKDDEKQVGGVTVFVKNLNFKTDDETLKKTFLAIGMVKKATVARKANMKDPSHPLSMGYGFVEYEHEKNALKAIKKLQNYELDGHRLELKLSHLKTQSEVQERKQVKDLEQKSPKIMVRNIPFESGKKEVMQLFGTFGKLKNVRLPKKMNSSHEHRGFGFVEFVTKEDAKRAFESLCHSTHLYGRRLVLEWAESEDTIADIRKRTARYFSSGEIEESITKRRKKLAKELLDTLETC